MRQALLRTRDFTPTDDPGFAAMQAAHPRPDVEPVEPAMGGADAFLAFVRDQVIPFVNDRYDVASEGSTLFGSSMGGLFVAHALHEAPDLVDNFMAVSPALWWGDAELMGRKTPEPPGAVPRVWLGAGGLEEAPHIPMLARFRLISNARELKERLVHDGFPPDTTVFDEIAGETHTSVVPVALTRGLRSVMPRTPPPAPEP
jgi:predicted alpha/beta superfamily hydrolase